MTKENKNKFEDRFSDASEEELMAAFNAEVGNRDWTSSRVQYLHALHEELEIKGIDYSEVGDEHALSFAEKIKIDEGQIRKV